MSLQLVSQGLTDAVMFTADGETVQPAEIFHKKAILVERGSFRPVTCATNEALDGALRQFLKESGCSQKDVVVLMEMTLENLLSEGHLNHADFLARVDILRELGRPVLISKFGEYYRLAAYLARYTNKMIGLVMGVPSLIEIFDEKYYLNLDGGILEALGRMFKHGLKLYVYPTIDKRTGKIVTATQIKVAPNLQSLFQYLIDNQFIAEITDFHPEVFANFPAGCIGENTVGRQQLGGDGTAGGGANHQGTRIFRVSRTGGSLTEPASSFDYRRGDRNQPQKGLSARFPLHRSLHSWADAQILLSALI